MHEGFPCQQTEYLSVARTCTPLPYGFCVIYEKGVKNTYDGENCI